VILIYVFNFRLHFALRIDSAVTRPSKRSFVSKRVCRFADYSAACIHNSLFFPSPARRIDREPRKIVTVPSVPSSGL